jgi:hypothetical protein
MFLILYFPHAIVQNIIILIVPSYQTRCDVRSLITIRILKRLSELLNVAALGINFFLYILGVNHYRSAAIQMLGLHHFHIFSQYLTVEHRNSRGSIALHRNSRGSLALYAIPTHRRSIQTDNSAIKLLKVINNEAKNGSPNSSQYIERLSR